MSSFVGFPIEGVFFLGKTRSFLRKFKTLLGGEKWGKSFPQHERFRFWNEGYPPWNQHSHGTSIILMVFMRKMLIFQGYVSLPEGKGPIFWGHFPYLDDFGRDDYAENFPSLLTVRALGVKKDAFLWLGSSAAIRLAKTCLIFAFLYISLFLAKK